MLPNDISDEARHRFFQKQVYMDEWKNSMTGENERPVIELLKIIGFEEGKDYERQYPVGNRFVIDFAFVNEQFALEVDGIGHRYGKQKALDKKRDRYFRENNWVPLRIRDGELFGFKKAVYKNLIKDIVLERREQYQTGNLYPIDFSHFIERDYE